MKNNAKILIMLLLLVISANLNAQWAKKIDCNNSTFSTSSVIDNQGNQYITGFFAGTAIFGTTTLNSTGNDDIFISKLDANGNFLWAKKAGGSNDDDGQAVAVDEDGNVYITGRFKGSAIFGATTLTSSGTDDIFIAKLDKYGNFIYAQKAGGNSIDGGSGVILDAGKSIAVEPSGYTYVTGVFIGSATFGTTTLTTTGGYNYCTFIAKLDKAGNYLWAKQTEGTGSVSGNAIAIDPTGNAYIMGKFNNQASFGSTTITSSGYDDIFVSKLDKAGNFLWAKKAGGNNYDEGKSVAVDASGNVYLTGYFKGTANFGTISLIVDGGSDIFISKLDANGNFIWVKKAGGSSTDCANSISIDLSGNAYITGYITGSAKFDTAMMNNIDQNFRSIFFAKFDNNGNFIGGKSYQSPYNNLISGNSIALNATGDIFFTGSFIYNVTFGDITLSGNQDSNSAYPTTFITKFPYVLPSTFSLISPSNGSYVSTTPFLKWTNSSNSLLYKVYIDNNLKTSVLENQYQFLPTEPLTDGLHTWYVTAINNTERQSEDTWSIMVDATPPNVFDLTTPVNNSWSANLKPTLSWSASTDNGSGLSKYQLWIDGILNRDSIAVTATSTTPTENLTNGSHTWQIKAFDMAGNVRSSSQIFTAKIDNTAPGFGQNRCLNFNGIDSYVSIENCSLFDINYNKTVEVWINFSEGGDFYPRIISQESVDNEGFYGEGWSIATETTGSQRKVQFMIGGIGYIKTQTSLIAGTWYHIAAVISGNPTSCNMRIYLNGVLDVQSNKSGTYKPVSSSLKFGRKSYTGNNSYDMFKGFLDEVRIWDYARSESDINKYKNISLKGNENGLVGYWRLNESSDNAVYDATSNQNNGINYNAGNYLNSNFGGLCILNSPANQYVSTNKPTFKWGSAPDAGVGFQKFQLFVDNIQKADNLTDTTYTLATVLSYGAHTWFVKGFDLLGNNGVSSTVSFNIDNRPPAPFSLNTPLDSGIVNLPTPSLSWIATTDSTGGSGLRKYQLYINGSVNRDSISSAVTTITPAQALPQGAYTWYINALDNAGNVKKSTQTRIFYVDYQPPTAFNLVSPANNSEALSKRPTFIWRKSKDLGSGLRKYELTISGYPPIIIAPTDTIKTISFDLPNANYTWFVKAIDRGGASTSSPTYNLTVNVPYPPALSAPQNNSLNQALTPFLRWSKVSVANGYHLQVSAVSNFSTFVVNDSLITDTLKQVTGLTNNTKYWWRVKAKRNEVSSDYSAVWNFTTIIAAPVQPVLATPTNNAVSQSVSPLLSWNEVSNAATYRLQAAKDSLFVDKIFDDSTLTVISKKLNGLEYSKKYFWRVNAKNIGGIGNWSEVNKFNTRDALAFNLPASLTFAEDTKDSLDLTHYVNELPSDLLNYTIWGNQNIQVSVLNNIARFTPAANWSGTENIILTLTDNSKNIFDKDGYAKKSSFKDFRALLKDTIAITVTPIADAPVIALPAKFTWGEDSIKTINFAPYLSDADGNNLSLNCYGNTHLQISFNNSLVTVKPDSNWFGNELVTFTANDGTKKCKNTKLTASDTVRFVINPVNDAPIVTFFSPSNSDTVIVFKDSTIVFKVRAYDVDSQIGYQWYIGNTLNPSTDSLLTKVFTTTGYYTVKSRIGDNIAFIETVWHVKVEMASNIDNQNLLPAVVKLEKNYPNPFNNTTSIKFALPNNDFVTLTIYNLKGEVVKQLANGIFNAGYHTISFDAAKLSSGVYTYTLKTKEKTITNRMLLVK